MTTMQRPPSMSRWNVACHFRKRKLLIAINAVCSLSIFFFGYDQGMMGGVNVAEDYIKRMGFGYTKMVDGQPTPVITDSLLQGGIVSIYYLGTLVGALLGGLIGERFGRIRGIAAGAGVAIVGATLQCSAMNHSWMICARLVNGWGTGILNAIVPVWAAESVSHTSRGAFIATEFTLNIFGVVVAYWMEYGLSFVDGGRSQIRWRFPVAFQIIPLLVLLGSVWFFPESPRWLVKVGREDEARYILGRLRGDQGNDALEAEAEFQEIKIVAAEQVHGTVPTSYWALISGRGSGNLHLGRRTQLVIWLQILQEWVGIAGVTICENSWKSNISVGAGSITTGNATFRANGTDAPTIFSLAGFDSNKSQWISGLNNIFYMFATLGCVFTLDRIGRRWTLYWGAAVQGIAMFLCGGFTRLGQINSDKGNTGVASGYGIAAASMIFIFTSTFGATWLTVPWLIPAEIFPLACRSKGNALGVVGWSIGNGWLSLLLPVCFEHIQEKTYYLFGIANAISIPIVWAFYPETNQRTLEQIDFLFSGDQPWNWVAEKNFARLSKERPALAHDIHRNISKDEEGAAEFHEANSLSSTK